MGHLQKPGIIVTQKKAGRSGFSPYPTRLPITANDGCYLNNLFTSHKAAS